MDLQALRNGSPVAGTMVRLVGNPAIAMMAKHAGLDFIMLDMEHGAFTFETLSGVCTVAQAAGVSPFVRVPELSRENVSRALDCGATGVMVPMLESVAQARDLVQWAKYPPLGRRGFATASGHTQYRCNVETSQFMAQANAGTLAIAQIETRAGAEAADGIAAVEGIDALLVGPNDLSISLGCAGNQNSPEQDAAIENVARAARRHGKIFGMHAPIPMLRKWMGHDLRLIMHAIDIGILAEGLKAVAENVRGLSAKKG